MRWLGFEPRYAAWKAAVIATRPPAHKSKFIMDIYKSSGFNGNVFKLILVSLK